MTKKDYELVEKYISNNLSEKEQELFDQKVQTDQEFLKEVKIHLELHDQLSDANKRRLNRTLILIESRFRQTKLYQNRRNLNILIAAAALIIFIISLWVFGFRDVNQEANSPPETTRSESFETDQSGDFADEQLMEKEIEEVNERNKSEMKNLESAPLPYFEKLIQNQKSDSNKLIVQHVEESRFQTAKNQNLVELKGRISVNPKSNVQNLSVLFFREDAKSDQLEYALTRAPVITKKDNEEIMGFAETSEIGFNCKPDHSFQKGVYYYTILDEVTGQRIYTGKIKIQ